MNNSNKIVNPNNIPKYKVGDFIITRKNGIGRICDKPNFAVWLKKPEWLYNYDYGLGLTSEGSILESDIRLLK